MKLLDLTLATPQENLALDEALLDFCEENSSEEILRFWESQSHFVVLGYSNKFQAEVDINACKANSISVLRRPSGGGTVLQGPGCLNYALVLKNPHSQPFESIHQTNALVMNKHCQSLQKLLDTPVSVQGISDLTAEGKKFSGNAQRRKKNYYLFHGTFLWDFNLNLIEKYLNIPEIQPEYRAGKSHLDFVRNIPLSSAQIKENIQSCWQANSPFQNVPSEKIKKLVEERYALDEWNLKY